MKLSIEITDTAWTRYDEEGDRIFGDETFETQVAHRVAELVVKKYDSAVKGWIEQQVRERAHGAIDALIAEAMAVPFRPTNAYGEPKGEPVTLREHLVVQARETMERKVNVRVADPKTGRLEIVTGYRQDGTRQMTAWEANVQIATSEAVPATINGAIASAVAELRERVKTQAHTALAEGVNKLLGLE